MSVARPLFESSQPGILFSTELFYNRLRCKGPQYAFDLLKSMLPDSQPSFVFGKGKDWILSPFPVNQEEALAAINGQPIYCARSNDESNLSRAIALRDPSLEPRIVLLENTQNTQGKIPDLKILRRIQNIILRLTQRFGSTRLRHLEDRTIQIDEIYGFIDVEGPGKLEPSISFIKGLYFYSGRNRTSLLYLLDTAKCSQKTDPKLDPKEQSGILLLESLLRQDEFVYREPIQQIPMPTEL